jgi:tol-pal system protein YbgF
MVAKPSWRGRRPVTMTRTDQNIFRTGLLLAAGALFFMAPAPALADPVTDRLNQLENQVQTLSRSIYRGERGAYAALETPGDSAAIAGFEERLSLIEAQQRDITGQLEKISYELQQLKDRLDKSQTDTESRLGQLEGGGRTFAPAPVPAYDSASSRDYDRVVSGGTLGTLGGGVTEGAAESLYEEAFADIRDAKYESAERKFGQFMELYPDHQLAPNAQYWLAETFYVRGDYKAAAKMFAQGYQDYPRAPKAADSLLKLGLSLSKLGKKEDACVSLRQLQKDFPGNISPATKRAQQELKQLGCD